MESRRITVRDIAREAGVHFTTVSRALSGHPSIPPSTREKIRGLATRLGYVPDPMLSALTAYRSRIRAPAYHGNIAWVTNAYTREGWAAMSETFRLHQEGAQKRARELGYKLEEFWLREPGMSALRASNVLAARNIRGLILPPQPKPKARVKLDWPRFAAVAFGYTLAWPALHVVTNHTLLSMQTAVRRARALGYRRLGLVLTPAADERVNHGWLGGFLALQHAWPARERVPVFADEITKPKPLIRWARQHRPDAVICHDSHVLGLLQEGGLRVPEDAGYLSQSLANHPPHIAGIDENAREAGAAAVNLLVGMIHRSEWGIPALPQSVLIRGAWKDGGTLPRRTPGGK